MDILYGCEEVRRPATIDARPKRLIGLGCSPDEFARLPFEWPAVKLA